MMAVSAPVLPPSYDPAALYPSPASSSSSSSSRGGERERPPLMPVLTPIQSTSPVAASRPPKLADAIIKSAMPPTPDPSPPTGKVLFPVQSVPLPPPAVESDTAVLECEERLMAVVPSSPTSSASTPSTNEHLTPAAFLDIPDAPPIASGRSDGVSPSPSKQSQQRRGSEQLSRASSGRNRPRHRPELRDRDDRDPERPRLPSRRSTLAVPGSGATSIRMTESRSADSRTRLRSNGHTKLAQYPTLSKEYPTSIIAPRRQSSTPPRISIAPSSDVDADLDYGGPGGLEAKVVLLGSQGVGKTSLILRLTTGNFSATPAPASLDGSLYKRKLVHNGVPIKLQIWDTAGQERFRSMAPIYYRGAHVCILVYDISDRKSFQDVRSWLDELHSKASKDMIIYVVGAKTDLERQRAVSCWEARRTIRTWLKPQPPPLDTEPEPEVMASPPSRSIFRSASSRSRPESVTGGFSPPRTRPHSMHGLASLMAAAASDFADVDSSPSPTPISSLVGPSPAPSVHFPAAGIAITSPSSNASSASNASGGAASQSTSPANAAAVPQRRQPRVSFHALHSPSPQMAQPTFATTAETATASTANSHTRERHASNRFSITGVLGLTRSPSVSDAVANLAHLAEANPVSPASERERERDRHDRHGHGHGHGHSHGHSHSHSHSHGHGHGHGHGHAHTHSLHHHRRESSGSRAALSPIRQRTESTPHMTANLPRQKSSDWSGGRGWSRGEGPSAADALEEFGAVVRDRGSGDASSSSAFAAAAALPLRRRSRGGSLGHDSRPRPRPLSQANDRLSYREDARFRDREDEDGPPAPPSWGIEVEGIRLGEVSSLTGEGVDELCRSISACLVERKDKIERDRSLRKKNSVMLTDPSRDATAKGKKRFACCA